MPDWSLEQRYGGIIAGVDEAGRGPWAGPVVAAAVILNPRNLPDGINDSKKLSMAKRDALYTQITQAHCYGVGVATCDEIDQLNVLGATKRAMQKAVARLLQKPECILVDGNRLPEFHCPSYAVIKGDSISLSIAAASIIAKVTRDRIMRQLALQYPGYGWERNAGYGTKEHQLALGKWGVTPQHRRSFRPIREWLDARQEETVA